MLPKTIDGYPGRDGTRVIREDHPGSTLYVPKFVNCRGLVVWARSSHRYGGWLLRRAPVGPLHTCTRTLPVWPPLLLDDRQKEGLSWARHSSGDRRATWLLRQSTTLCPGTAALTGKNAPCVGVPLATWSSVAQSSYSCSALPRLSSRLCWLQRPRQEVHRHARLPFSNSRGVLNRTKKNLRVW